MKKYAKEFRLSTAPQRSPQWYAERAGIPSASGLGLLFDTTLAGQPTAKQKKYLKELAYERKFKTTFQRFDTKAMQEGRYYEDFAKMVYARETGNIVSEAFSYISDWFVATPDANVVEMTETHQKGEFTETRGLLECKIVGDESFLDFIEDDIPLGHELQTQGQLMASGLDWVDYIIVNIKTRAYYIRRVPRNNKLIKRIYERLHLPLNLPEINFGDVKRFDDTMLQQYVSGELTTQANAPPIELPF